ncbi:hypothetical protein [Paenarthrobacter sp. Y-19]|uniref:hypothetical protein n=1 Tax=Paenarthrobacter sp. Y-19 TaxID=3031125 RepID=UPI0023DA8773|nr:hypothetical protein [Paenarthrobacter sp. Y-19]
MPNYVINEGLENEEVILAADCKQDGIQYWFYNPQGERFKSLLKTYAKTINPGPSN